MFQDLKIPEHLPWKVPRFLQHTKSAASKQNNMTTICREHHNKRNAYIPTHDLKLINLFDI